MRAPALQALGSRRGRLAVPLVLAGVVAAGWAGTLLLGAATEGHAEHHGGLAALFVMWAAMAVAMMVPVEAASLLRLARGLRDTGAFLAGYLLPWLAFGLGAAGLQQRLHAAGSRPRCCSRPGSRSSRPSARRAFRAAARRPSLPTGRAAFSADFARACPRSPAADFSCWSPS